ncbi:MAG: serine acetyltransferase [Pseudomonadota bacterium]
MTEDTDDIPGVLVGQDLIREMGIRAVMAEDYRTHGRNLGRPGLHAVLVHRLGVWAETFRRPIRIPLLILYNIGFSFCRAMYGIELPRSVKLGRRFEIGHQSGIVIHTWSTFGNDCIVRQGVTLGMATDARWVPGEGPVIGNNVSFSPGCIVIGNVRIGDNVQIGPNCVVTNDVPANRILFMSAPRVLPRQMPIDTDQTDNEDQT